MLKEFPSPCGEMVVKQIKKVNAGAHLNRQLFPSPCGEMVVKQ